MLQPAPAPCSHDEVFTERYQRLVGWALRLTEGQRPAAEDLVQDAFIQFTLKRPDLSSIESLDDYLYVMLRNLHISQVRRAAQTPTIRLSISDYDTAHMGLRLVDPQRYLQSRDELRRVCEYVTQRKETSKAASVLMLRFFHSYFPAEIAAILRTTRQAVEIWLLTARRECRTYLEDPTMLKPIGERKANAKKVVRLPRRAAAISSSDIFTELCETIFASRMGDCLTSDELCDLYEREETIERGRLAHTVSCPKCLETINQLLGLSSLKERYYMESSNIDAPPPSNSGVPPATSSGGVLDGIGKRLRRRRRETIEHRPQELRIAVNGFFLSRQKVGLPVNELALKLNLEEKISFIEVFSEQGLLLSHFTVTPPTDGEIEQHEEVEFGEGRALETTVSFNTQWPTLHVLYRDPLVAHLLNGPVDTEAGYAGVVLETRVVEERTGDVGPRGTAAEPHRSLPETDRDFGPPAWRRGLSGIFGAQFWLRPGAVTAVFALLLLATGLFVIRRPNPGAPVSAADLLQRSISAERTAAANTSTTSHRTLQIEEREGSMEGVVLARQRVELWQSADRGVTASRLYDEQGRLLAGEWTRSDNVTTLYRRGAKPHLRTAGTVRAPLSLENVWRLPPSAKEFVALVGEGRNVQLEERTNQYVLNYESRDGLTTPRLLQAKLVLNRDDLRAVEKALLVRQENDTRAYRIIETSFERRPNDAVAPAMFEPEPELLSSAGATTRDAKHEAALAAREPLAPVPIMATPALEVEVLKLLDQANAFMGEQVSVTHTHGGRLLVSGLVETEERKAELLRALATVRNHPAVRVDVETVTEAGRRGPPNSAGNITVEPLEATEGTSPAYAQLNQKFSEDEARRFADHVVARSRQARRHALALKQLTERFSLADLRTLPEADRARWVGLLRGHAREFQREVQGLRRELQQVFPALSGESAGGPPIVGDSEMQDAVRRLYEFSVACDEGVRQSFALSAQTNASPQVKTEEFRRTLRSTEALAARIQNAR